MWLLAVVSILLPIGVSLWLAFRSTLKEIVPMLVATAATGGVGYLFVYALRTLVEHWAKLDMAAADGGGAAGLLYVLLIVAPVQLGVVVTAMVPWWRLRRTRSDRGFTNKQETLDAVAFAVAVALGFASTRIGIGLITHASGWLDVLRGLIAIPTFALLCGLWGFALGRDAGSGLRSPTFRATWFGTVILAAATEQMIFHRGGIALLAVLPLLLCLLLLAWLLWRDVVRRDDQPRSTRFSSLSIAPSASLASLQEAFRRRQQPLTLRWISLGVLVTSGMMTAGLAIAIGTGGQLGIDFAVVDRVDAGARALVPLLLLGTGGLAAFPGAGYLLARASGTRSVIEPALAAALTIVLVMVVMGMAEPTSIVFAIAFAPIAFALSCIGAWFGLAD